MKRISVLALTLLALGNVAQGELKPSVPIQVSVGVGGAAPDGESLDPAMPPNGELLVFASSASNLVGGDSNDVTDIFLADKNNALSRVSVNSKGEQANGPSEEPAISPIFPDGGFGIAYASLATNLVPDIGPVINQKKQVYLYIPAINKTVLVSRATTGSDIGGDGDSVHATVTGVDEKAGRRYIVAYSSTATNVTSDNSAPPPGTANPTARIVFAVINAADGTLLTSRSILGNNGTPANASLTNPVLNGKGDTIAFISPATNLGYENAAGYPQVVVARKGKGDALELISRGNDGLAGSNGSGSPSMSFNGDFIAYQTSAYNILDSSASQQSAALFSSRNGVTSLINTSSQGVRGGFSMLHGVQINRTGRLAVFIDTGNAYVPNDTNQLEDVFVKDTVNGEIVRVNLSASGAQSDGTSRDPAIGGVGYNKPTALIAFKSTSSTLPTAGTGGIGNIYKVTLTFPPPPFTRETKLESPPDVTTSRKRLDITLQEFDLSVGTSSIEGFKQSSIEYDVRVTKLGAKKGIRRSTKTNRVVLRNLPAGKYNVRYRVTGKVDGKKVTTGYSPTITVVVTK